MARKRRGYGYTKPCPKCHQYCKLTRHHVFPRRWFGKGKNNNYILLICKECHRELEKRIPFSKMPKLFYQQVLNDFLEENYDTI
jgi:hypothetical protein